MLALVIISIEAQLIKQVCPKALILAKIDTFSSSQLEVVLKSKTINIMNSVASETAYIYPLLFAKQGWYF
jgi:hypothetical protein